MAKVSKENRERFKKASENREVNVIDYGMSQVPRHYAETVIEEENLKKQEENQKKVKLDMNDVSLDDTKDTVIKYEDFEIEAKKRIEKIVNENRAITKRTRSLKSDTLINLEMEILKDITKSKFVYNVVEKMIEDLVASFSIEEKKLYYKMLEAKLDMEVTLKSLQK